MTPSSADSGSQPASGPRRGTVLSVLALLIVGGAAVVASLAFGPTPIRWTTLFDPARSEVFWRLRLPRTLLAAAAGAGLSLGGVVFQALFRNPLATPYTLGIASGASFAASAAILLGLEGLWLGVPTVTLVAFAGCMASLGLVFALSRLRESNDVTHLLLGGVCISYLFAAGVMLMQHLASAAVTVETLKWMMGSLAFLRPRSALEVAVVLLPVLAWVVGCHRALDLIGMGEALAAGRGVAVERVRWTCFAAIGLLVAVIVANCGPIGFVGLMVPHMARAVVGPRTLPLSVASCALGAGFLALCDGIARWRPHELPVGVVTNILGAVFFFSLLARRPRWATP